LNAKGALVLKPATLKFAIRLSALLWILNRTRMQTTISRACRIPL